MLAPGIACFKKASTPLRNKAWSSATRIRGIYPVPSQHPICIDNRGFGQTAHNPMGAIQSEGHMECGGKRSATPLLTSSKEQSARKAVSALRSATALQNFGTLVFSRLDRICPAL